LPFGLADYFFLSLAPSNPPVLQEPRWDSPATRELAKRACFDCHSHETTVLVFSSCLKGVGQGGVSFKSLAAFLFQICGMCHRGVDVPLAFEKPFILAKRLHFFKLSSKIQPRDC
jgi:hypothetical protein